MKKGNMRSALSVPPPSWEHVWRASHSANVESEPIKIIHKVAFGFADLNKPDGVMFTGMLTYSAAYA